VHAATFSRSGGVSAQPYNTLNLSYNSLDLKESVDQNHYRIAQLFKGSLVTPNQVHGNKVLAIKNPNTALDCDGLITNEPGIALGIYHADCQAALFFDPKNQAIAAVHAGWRGLVAHIYQNTVSLLKETYGTNPVDLLVGISPSLGPCHAEFTDFESFFPRKFTDYQVEKNHFDLWQISHDQLTAMGIKAQNIDISHICTYCNRDEWFSYRRDKVTGRHLSFIQLRDCF